MVLLYLFANAKARQQPTSGKTPSSQRFSFYGLDAFSLSSEHTVLDTLNDEAALETHRRGKIIDALCNGILHYVGGSGGSWYKLWRMRKAMSQSDTVVATADRVGIPLVLLSYFHLIPKRRIVYVSIGLPERLQTLKPFFRRLYLNAFHHVTDEVICYGHKEHLLLQHDLGLQKPRVWFVPFGVDTNTLIPQDPSTGQTIVCVGADPHRDFHSLFILAERHPMTPFLVITSRAHQRKWKRLKVSIPTNVTLQYDLPFVETMEAVSQSKFVVLPVFENSYSGATTTLLQAMALGKAVIVTKTGAIADGYHLAHEQNVLFVPPEDIEALDVAFTRLSTDPALRMALGAAARETVARHLNWQRYSHQMYSIITGHQTSPH